LDLLAWTIGTLDRKTIEAKWHFLMPPILKMMDDIDGQWKAKGCHMLGLLLETLRAPNPSSSKTQSSTTFLHRTGYHNIFADALFPLFTYIPSLTPEPESVIVFKQALPTITSLALVCPTNESQTLFLDKILHQGVLSPLTHFPTPASYPALATVILSHMPVLVTHMRIEIVKHLPHLLPLLSNILQDPFALSHTPLVLETLRAVQSVLMNAWPRIHQHRGTVMMGLCLLWERCAQEGSEDGEVVREAVKETVGMLDAIMQADVAAEVWEGEKRDIVLASKGLEGLFGECGGDAKV
jgi:hypothetical protein